MDQYWKSIVAALVAIAITTVQAIVAAQSDGVWTLEDTLVTLLAFLGAVGVWAKENAPTERQREKIAAAELDSKGIHPY